MIEMLGVFLLSFVFDGMQCDSWECREASTKLMIYLNNELDLRTYIRARLKANPEPELERRLKKVIEIYYTPLPAKCNYLPRFDAWRDMNTKWQEMYEELFNCEYNYHQQAWEYTMYDGLRENNYAQLRMATYDYIKILFKNGHTRRQIVDRLSKMIENEEKDLFFKGELTEYARDNPQGPGSCNAIKWGGRLLLGRLK